MDLKKMGLFLVGMINNKNLYEAPGKPARYTLDMVIPGMRQLLPVGVEAERFHKVAEGQTIGVNLAVSTFKGMTFFQEKDVVVAA